jgi:hypothetical protein
MVLMQLRMWMMPFLPGHFPYAIQLCTQRMLRFCTGLCCALVSLCQGWLLIDVCQHTAFLHTTHYNSTCTVHVLHGTCMCVCLHARYMYICSFMYVHVQYYVHVHACTCTGEILNPQRCLFWFGFEFSLTRLLTTYPAGSPSYCTLPGTYTCMPIHCLSILSGPPP